MRLTLLALALLAAGGGFVQIPWWSRLLLAATAAAIPGAVALQHGRVAVRALLGRPNDGRYVVWQPDTVSTNVRS
ncbi:hypothetical protein ABZ738_32470 [Micromonospora sp. NPDC047793]|uniref:hypothetical protein n=1 Tax=Micromonospora sp. NPDC047793 TaxID=3154342 RepID=UPI0034095F71